MTAQAFSVEPVAEPVRYLNCAAGFWDVYSARAGHPRRAALEALFRQHPQAKLPVNNKWQATTQDKDLSVLLKKGVLRRIRSGGGARHPLNRTSSKRQTYLVLG